MGRSTVCGILKDTCEATWNVLMPQFVRAPATTVEWEGVSRQFEQMWNVHIVSVSLYDYSIDSCI